MRNNRTEPTMHDNLQDARDALSQLPHIDDIDGKTDCLRRIATAEQATKDAYDDALATIMLQVKDNIDLLNEHFAPILEDVQQLSNDAKQYVRDTVYESGERWVDGKWLLVSFIKPTIKIDNKEKLLGYLIARPEAQGLIKDVPATTRVARWRPDLLDE